MSWSQQAIVQELGAPIRLVWAAEVNCSGEKPLLTPCQAFPVHNHRQKGRFTIFDKSPKESEIPVRKGLFPIAVPVPGLSSA